jgi:hypothetical protein
VACDQSELHHIGLQSGSARNSLHSGGQPHHLIDPGTFLGGGEVAPHPLANVLRLSDVKHVSRIFVFGDEEIHARLIGQICCPGALRAPLRRHPPSELLEVLNGVHAEIAHPLDQTVKHVHGGPRVDQGTVIWCRRRPKVPGQGRQAAIGHFVPQQDLAGERRCVDHWPARRGISQSIAGSPKETDIEGRIVSHDHGVLGEGQKGRQHSCQHWGVGDHRVGDAGQHRDEWGNVG